MLWSSSETCACVYIHICIYMYIKKYTCALPSLRHRHPAPCACKGLCVGRRCAPGESPVQKCQLVCYIYTSISMYTSEFLFVREEIPPQGSERSSRCRAPGADVQLGGTKSGLPGSMRAKIIRERQPQPVCVRIYIYTHGLQ